GRRRRIEAGTGSARGSARPRSRTVRRGWGAALRSGREPRGGRGGPRGERHPGSRGALELPERLVQRDRGGRIAVVLRLASIELLALLGGERLGGRLVRDAVPEILHELDLLLERELVEAFGDACHACLLS